MELDYCPKRAKICYLTAKDAAKAMHRTGHSRLNVFKCPHCNFYHLGRPKRAPYPWRRKGFDWREELKMDPLAGQEM